MDEILLDKVILRQFIIMCCLLVTSGANKLFLSTMDFTKMLLLLSILYAELKM